MFARLLRSDALIATHPPHIYECLQVPMSPQETPRGKPNKIINIRHNLQTHQRGRRSNSIWCTPQDSPYALQELNEPGGWAPAHTRVVAKAMDEATKAEERLGMTLDDKIVTRYNSVQDAALATQLEARLLDYLTDSSKSEKVKNDKIKEFMDKLTKPFTENAELEEFVHPVILEAATEFIL